MSKEDLSETDPRVIKALEGVPTAKMRQFAMIIAKSDKINATQAHKDAGYKATEGSHGVQGHRLMRDQRIIDAVGRLRALLGKTYSLTIDDVLDNLAYAVDKAKEKGDLANMLRGLELQGKHMAMWVEKTVTEDANESKRLSQKEAEELREIAKLRLRKVG